MICPHDYHFRYLGSPVAIVFHDTLADRRKIVMKYGTVNSVKRGGADAHHRAKICESLITTASNHEFIRRLLPFILSQSVYVEINHFSSSLMDRKLILLYQINILRLQTSLS